MVGSCSIFLAVIGNQWVNVRDSDGQRRLDNPGDYVRIEIESALNRRIPLIPLLVQGASMPTENELPLSIKDLAFRNGLPIRSDPDFHKDMDRLIAGLIKH